MLLAVFCCVLILLIGYCMTKLGKNFSDGYKEEVFLIWFKNGRPVPSVLRDLLTPNHEDLVPTIATLRTWKRNFRWDDRADTLDALVVRKIEASAVEEKVRMLKKHAETAEKLQELGMEHLIDKKIDSSSVALKMVTEGIAIERESKGLPDALLKMAEMEDEKLIDTVSKLMDKLPSGKREEISEQFSDEDVVDGEFIDAESE